MLTLEKVTTFVTRAGGRGIELLLFEHPYAGLQIPAGTVEAGEAPHAAALREAAEETGLADLHLVAVLGAEWEALPAGKWAVVSFAPVYARPDTDSFNWATLRRGIWVREERRAPGFTQITYQEMDDSLNPQYVSYQITGWVTENDLTNRVRRHFYLLEATQDTSAQWTVHTDNHRFTLSWASLEALPAIHPGQAQWIRYLLDYVDA